MLLDKLPKRLRLRQRASDVTEAEVGTAKKAVVDEDDYEPTKRWLPIASGLLCPFSVLLDIPGLTEKWYVRTVGLNVVETQPNPTILDVGLGFSMATGVLANVALIFRFLERKVLISTWVAILALTAHDIINIVTLVTFGVSHAVPDGFQYGQAYWQTTAATVASLGCNITLVIDYVRTKNFGRHGSGLTEKQRSLVIAVMVFLGWIAVGSLCFTYLFDPHLSFIESMYFVIVTTTSVGLGDIVPTNVAGRVFSFFYDPIAIVMLAWCIAVARETIIESFEASYRHRRDVLAQKARERKEEKRKRMQLRRERREKDLEHLVDQAGVSIRDMHDKTSFSTEGAVLGGARRGSNHALVKAAKTKREIDYMCEREQGMSVPRATIRLWLRKFGLMRPLDGNQSEKGLQIERTLSRGSTMSEDSFKSFKHQLQQEQRKEFRIKVTSSLGLFFVFWLVGAAVFSATESWSYFEGMWFCFIFFSTIGYGDFHPQTSGGRSFFLIWALFGIATMTILISVLTESWSSRYRSSIVESRVRRTIRRVQARRATESADGESPQDTRPPSLQESNQNNGDALVTEPVRPSDIAHRLVKTARDFDQHARYFMSGRTGQPPERLRAMTHAVDEFEEEIVRLHESGDLDMTGHTDIKHFMFMMSYEKALEALVDAADSMTELVHTHNNEIETMKELNGHLRCAIHETRHFTTHAPAHSPAASTSGSGAGESDQTKHELEEASNVEEKRTLMFEAQAKRPPGGFGDELTEREVEAEFEDEDGDDADDDDDDSREGRREEKQRKKEDRLARLSPRHLLDRSSQILHRHQELIKSPLPAKSGPTSNVDVESGKVKQASANESRPPAAGSPRADEERPGDRKKSLTFDEPVSPKSR